MLGLYFRSVQWAPHILQVLPMALLFGITAEATIQAFEYALSKIEPTFRYVEPPINIAGVVVAVIAGAIFRHIEVQYRDGEFRVVLRYAGNGK